MDENNHTTGWINSTPDLQTILKIEQLLALDNKTEHIFLPMDKKGDLSNFASFRFYRERYNFEFLMDRDEGILYYLWE